MSLTLRACSPRRLLNRAVGSLVHWISLNRVMIANGVVFKRRNGFGRRITPMANRFFKWVGTPVRFWGDLKGWQRWEVSCYHMLHPGYEVLAVGSDAICMEQLPGVSLWEHLVKGTLTREMMEAAGRELRRGHEMYSELYGGGWSHGDGAVCNFMYDSQTRRAMLIDFEIVHDQSLSASRRQADDLSAFLLDVACYSRKEQWPELAMAFLRAYGRVEPIQELRMTLDTQPRGPSWIWWKIRANFAGSRKIARRLKLLGEAIDQDPSLGIAGDVGAEVGVGEGLQECFQNR